MSCTDDTAEATQKDGVLSTSEFQEHVQQDDIKANICGIQSFDIDKNPTSEILLLTLESLKMKVNESEPLTSTQSMKQSETHFYSLNINRKSKKIDDNVKIKNEVDVDEDLKHDLDVTEAVNNNLKIKKEVEIKFERETSEERREAMNGPYSAFADEDDSQSSDGLRIDCDEPRTSFHSSGREPEKLMQITNAVYEKKLFLLTKNAIKKENERAEELHRKRKIILELEEEYWRKKVKKIKF